MQIRASDDPSQNGTTKTPSYPLFLEPITVTRLTCDDIFRAAKTFQRAFANDPIFRYIRNERKQTLGEVMLDRLLIALQFLLWIRTKMALTVRAGSANIICRPPRDAVGKPRRDSFTDLLRRMIAALSKYQNGKMSELEKRRRNEVDLKMQDAVMWAFGTRAEKMWLIEDLWTDTRLQGRGYGGALLDTATAMADWAGRSTWLQSSNTANARFYAQHGFHPVATLFLGKEDPLWHHQPVIVNIMVREPRWPPLDIRTSARAGKDGIPEKVDKGEGYTARK